MPLHHTEDDNLVRHLEATFSHDGPTTVTAGVIPGNEMTLSTYVYVVSGFNGSAPSLQVGFQGGNTGGLVDAQTVDLTKGGEGTRVSAVTFSSANQTIILTVGGSGATDGNGRVVVTYI